MALNFFSHSKKVKKSVCVCKKTEADRQTVREFLHCAEHSLPVIKREQNKCPAFRELVLSSH